LKILRAGIAGPAEEQRAAILAREKWPYRIPAHVGIHGDGIRAVAVEGLSYISFGGIADVAALCIQYHQRGRCTLANVANARGELLLGADRAVERDLRFVGSRNVKGCIDDTAIEGIQRL